jgi:hypothetical protein
MKEYSGPWFWTDSVPDAFIGMRAIVDCDGFTVCDPSPMGQDKAHLIAAAPALLAALEALLEQADLGEVCEETQPIVDQARAAIAAARGEA